MDREAPFQTCRVTGTLPADRPDSLVAQFPLKPPSLVRFPILTAPGLILRHVDVVLGIVLALAGTLKGQQVLADSFGGLASAAPRALLVAAALEIAFGCWLVAGLCRRITRWIAVVWFTSLAAVALASAIDGADSCGCLRSEEHTSE